MAEFDDWFTNDLPGKRTVCYGEPLIFYYVDHLEMTIFNSWLVVQCAHLEEYEFVNGKDYPPYIVENKIHVWNHQTR